MFQSGSHSDYSKVLSLPLKLKVYIVVAQQTEIFAVSAKSMNLELGRDHSLERFQRAIGKIRYGTFLFCDD